MIENIPIWVSCLFLLSWLIAIFFFYLANNRPKKLTGIIILYSCIQCLLAYSGFYNNAEAIPPRFIFALAPSFILITYALLPKQIEWVLQNRNLKYSTLLHSDRILVELVLHQLFIFKVIPQLMTFEGRNFDIVAGITGLILGLYLLVKPLNKNLLIIWNSISLCLVLFIMGNGILSARLPIQQFGLDQPNVAMEYFPFILLPAVIVPMVIYTHISDLIKLSKSKN